MTIFIIAIDNYSNKLSVFLFNLLGKKADNKL